jgi:hypothetical protein
MWVRFPPGTLPLKACFQRYLEVKMLETPIWQSLPILVDFRQMFGNSLATPNGPEKKISHSAELASYSQGDGPWP